MDAMSGKTLMEVFEKDDEPEGLTVEEIYEKLGLQDPFEYALKQVTKHLEKEYWEKRAPIQRIRESNRDTGKTTYMMVHALKAASQGKLVEVVGRTRASTALLVQTMRICAHQLGISGYMVERLLGDPRERTVYDDILWSS